MKSIFALLLCVTHFSFFGQNTSVPYRVGNLFGLQDSKQKMVIKPQFDIIEVVNFGTLFYVGYNLNNGNPISSVLFEDKVILKDKPYRDYNIENELIIATKYIIRSNAYSYTNSEKNYTSIVHLYDKKGNPIIEEDCKYIDILSNTDAIKTSNEVLIHFKDHNDKYSAVLYNKKLKKITTYYIDKSDYLDIKFNENYDFRDKSITYIFRDTDGKGKKLILLPESTGIKTLLKEDIAIAPKKENEYDHDYTAVAEGDYYQRNKTITKNDSIILSYNKVEMFREYFYYPKKIEKVKFQYEKNDGTWAYIIKRNDKLGLKSAIDNTLKIPAEYDEILRAEIGGPNSCFLLKKNGKYGAKVFGMKKNIAIEPVFDTVFLIEAKDYFGEDNPLLKVYDKEGNFFCYAKKDGTLFYRE